MGFHFLTWNNKDHNHQSELSNKYLSKKSLSVSESLSPITWFQFDSRIHLTCYQADKIKGKSSQVMACSANHSKVYSKSKGLYCCKTIPICLFQGSGGNSAVGAGLIVGQQAWLQQKIHLRPQHRGVHLVTEEILRQVK